MSTPVPIMLPTKAVKMPIGAPIHQPIVLPIVVVTSEDQLHRTSGLNLIRCGWSASAPFRRLRSSMYAW